MHLGILEAVHGHLSPRFFHLLFLVSEQHLTSWSSACSAQCSASFLHRPAFPQITRCL